MASASSWFVDLARNGAWANARLHASCAKLSAAELGATRTSFFPAIDRTLWHIALVDAYYLDAIEGGGRALSIFDDHDTPPALEAIRTRQLEADRALVGLARALDDAALERVVAIDRGARGIRRERLGDVLLHVFTHAIHHRGQVHAMLSGTSVAPPQLDEYFLAEDRLAADAVLAPLGL